MQVLNITPRSLALAILLLPITPAAMANQCGDISPLFDQLGEQYYELDETPKSASFNHSIEPNNLIETLQSTRFKTGQGERTLCLGVSDVREQVRDFKLESIETASTNGFNEMALNAYEYDAKKNSTHRETIFIPLSTKNISLTGDNSFVVNTRHRQSVNARSNSITTVRGTHLREISITASSNSQGVEIKQSIYVNGHLAEWFTWRLDS